MKDFLNFIEIKRALASYPHLEGAKEKVEALGPFLAKEELKEELANLKEAYNFLANEGSLTFPFCYLIEPSFTKARKLGALAYDDIKNVYDLINGYEIAKKTLEKEEGLASLVAYGPELSMLLKEIERIYDDSGKMKDNASSNLLRLRNNLKELESKRGVLARSLSLKYRELLNNPEPIYRDSRYYLVVKVSFKNKIDGLIIGYSSSGESAYVAPKSLLELENEILDVKQKEALEEKLINAKLTSRLLSYEQEIRFIEEKLSYLDFLFSKARYSLDHHLNPLGLASEHKIALYDLFHPGLGYQKSIKNTFIFDDSKKLYVLSGPNAGGKTVALLALGLAVMSFMNGLAVAASSDSEICYISKIYGDIGDNQSIKEATSTFSGHIKNVAEALNNIDEDSLVLLDELASGTDPSEGEALALAILEEILAKKSFGLITSHYERVKSFALSEVTALNASFSYSEDGKPTYKMRLGLPGDSLALKAAETYGLSKEVIAKARSYLNVNSDMSLASALAKIEALQKEYEDKLATLNEEVKTYRTEKEAYEVEKKRFEERKKSILKEAKEEANEIIKEAQTEVDNILSSAKTSLKPHEVNELKARLNSLESIEEEEETFNEELSIDDYVEIPSFEIVGRVASIKGNKVVINANGASYTVAKDKVKKTAAPTKKKEVTITKSVETPAKLELNLLGMRVAEAKEELARYLDNCRLKGLKRVRIIHGFGSGALSHMVEDYLLAHPEFIASFEKAAPSEGGGGATIVKLV